jgi:F0F1-type ATP synthase delta subunit
MKYQAKSYAKAFVQALDAEPTNEDSIVRNTRALLIRTGDISYGEQVISAIKHELVLKHNGRQITLETAHVLSKQLRNNIMQSFTINDNDVVIDRIRPELGAGVRIVIDEEKDFNATLQYKLQKLLHIYILTFESTV